MAARAGPHPARVEQSGDRPDFAFLGISPNGSDLYVVYDGVPRPVPRRTRRVDAAVRGSPASRRRHRDVAEQRRRRWTGARWVTRAASSANTLIDEFMGDYNTVDATNGGAVSVFNDASNAGVCDKMNAFRQATVDGTAGAPPAPADGCPDTFGNTDILAAVAADPSP